MSRLSQHIPEQLRKQSMTVNSIVKGRTTQRFNPVNGPSGYSGSGQNKIEINLSHIDLFDFSTMVLSVNYTRPAECVFDGLLSSCFKTVEVYLADKLLERIENYGLWEHAIVQAWANDSFFNNELQATSRIVNEAGHATIAKKDFLTGFDLLGITKIKQYLPLLNNNLRLVITLNTAVNCHVKEATKTTDVGADYKLDNVSLLIDTLEVQEGYKAQFMGIIASEDGIEIPVQTLDVKERKLTELMHFNLSYAEADSFYGLTKGMDTATDTNVITTAPLLKFESLQAQFSGKYLTPNDGLKGYTELYMAMRKSFASLHDASGSTLIGYDDFKNLTLVGIDAEKLPAGHEVVSNGLNTRANGYNLDLKFGFEADVDIPVGAKFYLAVLHRKIMRFSNNSLEIAD